MALNTKKIELDSSKITNPDYGHRIKTLMKQYARNSEPIVQNVADLDEVQIQHPN